MAELMVTAGIAATTAAATAAATTTAAAGSSSSSSSSGRGGRGFEVIKKVEMRLVETARIPGVKTSPLAAQAKVFANVDVLVSLHGAGKVVLLTRHSRPPYLSTLTRNT